MITTDTFAHDGKIYDLTKTRILLRTQPTFFLSVSQLTWVLNYDKPSEERVLLAKHRYPLIVTKWNGRWTVIDGLHRLEKYRRKGVKLAPVREATPEILSQTEVHTKVGLEMCLSVRFPFLNNQLGLFFDGSI